MSTCGSPAYAQDSTINPKNSSDLYYLCQQTMLEASQGNPDFLDKVTHRLSVDDRSAVKRACTMYYQGILDGMKVVLAIKESKPR